MQGQLKQTLVAHNNKILCQGISTNILTQLCTCNPYIVCNEHKQLKATCYVGIASTKLCQDTQSVLLPRLSVLL